MFGRRSRRFVGNGANIGGGVSQPIFHQFSIFFVFPCTLGNQTTSTEFFKVGDLIARYISRETNKLAQCWQGDFMITRVLDNWRLIELRYLLQSITRVLMEAEHIRKHHRCLEGEWKLYSSGEQALRRKVSDKRLATHELRFRYVPLQELNECKH